jgi:hypothetical protein
MASTPVALRQPANADERQRVGRGFGGLGSTPARDECWVRLSDLTQRYCYA